MNVCFVEYFEYFKWKKDAARTRFGDIIEWASATVLCDLARAMPHTEWHYP
jgi:hypothetical protein